jgi:hypothetical protein
MLPYYISMYPSVCCDIQAHLTLGLAVSDFFADQMCKISGRLVPTWYSMPMNNMYYYFPTVIHWYYKC